ncbi:hypothetical protein [Nocardioides sp. SR21]|uniref:hypothetical protein n=1 Tax=Nocardioides sp. SR21 TaxID=2919501 RepID=UPI001FAA9C7B|nr:hypothetical protein [Nocardioides sp. SR21]
MQSNPDGPRDPDETPPSDPSGAAQEEAWQAIIENYGERADLNDEPEPPSAAPAPATPVSTAPFGGRFGNLTEGFGDNDDVFTAEEESYEPPPPPPVPRATPDRMAAWIGVFGSPAVLLTAVILGITLPTLIGYALVAAFVGGFLYLVFRMPRGPRDPWDDGAQV